MITKRSAQLYSKLENINSKLRSLSKASDDIACDRRITNSLIEDLKTKFPELQEELQKNQEIVITNSAIFRTTQSIDCILELVQEMHYSISKIDLKQCEIQQDIKTMKGKLISNSPVSILAISQKIKDQLLLKNINTVAQLVHALKQNEEIIGMSEAEIKKIREALQELNFVL